MTLNYVEEVVRRNVLRLIKEGKYNEANRLSREHIKRVYESRVKDLGNHELSELLQSTVYRLMYIQNAFDLSSTKAYSIGSVLSWVQVIKDGYRIFEIGTALGLTCSTIIRSFDIEEYITIDDSSLVLAVALYRNPLETCMKALWNDRVKILLGNAHQIVHAMRRESFDHIIYKAATYGREKLYSAKLLRRLTTLLKSGGTMSFLIVRDKTLSNKVHYLLSLIGMQVRVVKIPCTSVTVLHAVKTL
mgnify:CR=1 FL=1